MLASYDRATTRPGRCASCTRSTRPGIAAGRYGSIRVPTVVIHGTADPLVRPISGRAWREIPDASW